MTVSEYIKELQTYEEYSFVVDGKVVTPESYCEKCKQYGEYIREHTGFGGIIKRKGGKVGKL